MRKLLTMILTIAMLMSLLVFTANAADNEWAVYAGASSYGEGKHPRVPGIRYVDLGVQMYTITDEVLQAMGKTAFGTLQTKEKVSYKNGLSMTVVVDKFNDSGADKWLSFSIWDSQNIDQGCTGYGCGWFCLIRPNSIGCAIESWMCSPTVAMTNLTQTNSDVNIYEGEAITLEIIPEDGTYNVYVNGIDMNAGKFVQYMEKNEAYIGLTGYQGVSEQIVFTVTEFNDSKPTGTDASDPYIPDDFKPRPTKEETPATPEGEPCWLWNADRVKDGKPGYGMSSNVNDDGSLHITFDNSAPEMGCNINTGSYEASEFPVWAILYKGLDEIGGSASLFYFSGDVIAPQSDSLIGFDWMSGDYDEGNDTGWRILCIDLTEEMTWKGLINGFNIQISGAGTLDEQEADIMWIGFFRSEKEAYIYANMGAYYDSHHNNTTTNVDDTTALVDDTTALADDTTAASGDNTVDDGTQAAPGTAGITTDGSSTGEKKSNTGAIIGIVVAAVVVVAAIVCGIVLSKKKKQ